MTRQPKSSNETSGRVHCFAISAFSCFQRLVGVSVAALLEGADSLEDGGNGDSDEDSVEGAIDGQDGGDENADSSDADEDSSRLGLEFEDSTLSVIAFRHLRFLALHVRHMDGELEFCRGRTSRSGFVTEFDFTSCFLQVAQVTRELREDMLQKKEMRDAIFCRGRIRLGENRKKSWNR